VVDGHYLATLAGDGEKGKGLIEANWAIDARRNYRFGSIEQDFRLLKSTRFI
jgi:hypothetical protein